MKEEIVDLESIEIDDLTNRETDDVETSVVMTESYSSIKDVLEYLLKEMDSSQDYSKITTLLNEATVGLTVKCVGRVAKILTRLEKVEETLFNLEVAPHQAADEQESFSKQAISILEVTRKFIALVKDLGISGEGSPKRRRLGDLLESLSDEDVDKLLSLIEEQVVSSV